MFNKNIRYKDLIIAIVIAVIISVIAYEVIENYLYFFNIIKKTISLLMPFIYSLVIAYMLNPLVKALQKRLKLKLGNAILLTYLILVGGLILIVVYCVPNIIQSVIDLTRTIPTYIAESQREFNEILNIKEVQNILSNTGTIDSINNLISQVGTMIVALLEGFVAYIFTISSEVVKWSLGIIISIYVLVDKERLILEVKKVTFLTLKEKKATKLIEAVRIYHKMIGTYIGIKAIDSAIIAFLALILLSIVGSEYTILLAVIVGITNMIPYFGPFIGEIVGLLFNIFVSPSKAIVVFLVLLSLQMFDGWYLDPKLIGKKVGVRPFFIILAVVIGGGLYGAIGMLLASPTVATIKIYYERLMNKNSDIVNAAKKV